MTGLLRIFVKGEETRLYQGRREDLVVAANRGYFLFESEHRMDLIPVDAIHWATWVSDDLTCASHE